MIEWSSAKVLFNNRRIKKILQGRLDYPQMAEVWLTNRCNLNCSFCNETDFRSKIVEDISLKVITNLCLVNDISAIVLEGGGEPTLHPEFNSIVRRFNHFGKSLGIITNGTNLINPELLKMFSFIRISLDALDVSSYKRIKGVDLFDKVIDNIIQTGEFIKNNNLNTRLGISFIINDSFSIKDIRTFLNNMKHLPVSYIQFKPEDVIGKTDSDYIKFYDEFSPILANRDTNFEIYLTVCESKNSNCPCYANILSTTILNNGDVLFCKRLKSILDCKIGNLGSESAFDIFYGSKRSEMFKRFLNQDNCSICPTCRLTKYNEYLFKNKQEILMTGEFL